MHKTHSIHDRPSDMSTARHDIARPPYRPVQPYSLLVAAGAGGGDVGELDMTRQTDRSDTTRQTALH